MEMNISTVADILWAKICEKVRKSVVFVDDESAECLHWAGGLERLMCAGAVDVKQLSSFESGDPEQKKAVFVTSSLLFELTSDIIKDILRSSAFQYVIVITNMSAAVHLWKKTGSSEGDDRDVFFQFEEKLLEWMGDMNYTAEVLHLPHSIASITGELFVTPANSDLFPFLPHEYKKLEMKQNVLKAMKPKSERKAIDSLADIDAAMLPEEFAERVKALVCSMNGVLETLKVADECYSVGHTSRMVALELAAYPPARNRRKTATKRASVVFVDRTLDLASVCGNHGDTLADRVLNLLPRLPGHRNDVAVDMTPLSHLNRSCKPDILVPGCLAHAPDDKASSLLSHMFTLGQKDSTSELNQELIQAARKEKLRVADDKPGRVTAERLRSHVKLFKDHPSSIGKHSGLLQLAQAGIQTLGHGGNKSLDSMHGLEKMVTLCQNDEDSSVGEQLIQVLTRTGSGKEFSVDQFLSLLVYVHSIYGDDLYDSAQEERELQQKLQKCLLSQLENGSSETVMSIFGESLNKENVKARLGDVFGALKALGRSRQHLKKFKSLAEPLSPGLPPVYQPLLKRILETLFDPSKPELVDVEYRSGGLRDYLKTGFSLFMNVSKPRPTDCPIMIVYVIGGVTGSESKIVHEMAQKANCQIILGGSRLLNRDDALGALFVQNRVK